MLEIVQWIVIGAAIGSISAHLNFIYKKAAQWQAPLLSIIGAIAGGAAVSINSDFQAYADAGISSLILSVIGAVLTLAMYKGTELIKEKEVHGGTTTKSHRRARTS